MRVLAVVLGVFVLAAVAWPVPTPPVRPKRSTAESVDAPAVVSSTAPDEGPGPHSRDPGAPPPPPGPPPNPPEPSFPCGEVLGCVEDEDGCAVASFSLSSRTFSSHRRRGRPAGRGEPGPGGTFRFRVQRLDFFRDEMPPDNPPNRTLFTVWADGFVVRSYELPDEDEPILRGGGRLTGIRIVLARALLVQGQVFWPNGGPVKGHWVTVTTRKKDRVVNVGSTRTDQDGWYRFRHLEARAGLRIHAAANLGDSKHRTSSERIPLGDNLAGGDLLHVDLRLRPWESTKE